MTKIFNKVPIKEVVKRAAPKSATLFAHAVAPALNKRLRESQNPADAVAKRNVPTF
jgi:hypothetical protein